MNKNEMPAVRAEEITQDNGGVMGPWTSTMCPWHEVQALKSYAEKVTKKQNEAVELLERVLSVNACPDNENTFSLLLDIAEYLKEED